MVSSNFHSTSGDGGGRTGRVQVSPTMVPIESRHMVKEDSHTTPQAHQSIEKSSM